MIYGRTMYEIMRYWDDEQPGWDAERREFAAAWRGTPKWVVSRSLQSVGPNAALIAGDAERAIRGLKVGLTGEVGIGGPNLVQSLSGAGLVDEYRIYLRPVVLGTGAPFFAGTPPPLRFSASEVIGDGVIRLTYVLA